MCGIAGILAEEDTLPSITRMVISMNHRGPDDRGIQILHSEGREVALGTARLAIIDLSVAGHMPMNDPVTGNWITFNGEVYNFRAVRRDLERRGYTFHSGTDTEVVLTAYQEWGPACVERLRGMFALALWDAGRRELFLARDRVGEKPLYYVQDVTHQRFLFASEIRTLLASGLVERRLDASTLSVYLHSGHTVAPRTMVRSVRSMMPGCWMRVGDDGAIREVSRYWKIPIYDGTEGSTSLDEIRSILSDAVQMRMISEVPLGAFLSGGQDSSAIVALMSQHSKRVRTFSIGFDEQAYDESPYAKWVADRFRTDHTAVTLGPREFADWLDDGLCAMDQPTFDGLNTYVVSRAARESGLTVALSGLGGDELFGGYPFFNDAPAIARAARATRMVPQRLKETVVELFAGTHGFRKGLHIFSEPIPDGLHLLAGYQVRAALFPESAQRALLAAGTSSEDVWFGLPQEFVAFVDLEGRDADLLSQLSRYALHLFQSQRTLRDSDAMSMGVSLELRSAFTDHVLIEALWKLPGRIRCTAAPDKPYQTTLVRPILGDDFPVRKKQGFIFPFREWLKAGETFERVREVLRSRALATAAGLDAAAVTTLEEKSATLPWSRVWSVYVLLNWIDHNQVTM
jgi:asparagine synthase (glutamine-hydrolysing)